MGTGIEKSRLSWKREENDRPDTVSCCVGVQVYVHGLALLLERNWMVLEGRLSKGMTENVF